ALRLSVITEAQQLHGNVRQGPLLSIADTAADIARRRQGDGEVFQDLAGLQRDLRARTTGVALAVVEIDKTIGQDLQRVGSLGQIWNRKAALLVRGRWRNGCQRRYGYAAITHWRIRVWRRSCRRCRTASSGIRCAARPSHEDYTRTRHRVASALAHDSSFNSRLLRRWLLWDRTN